MLKISLKIMIVEDKTLYLQSLSVGIRSLVEGFRHSDDNIDDKIFVLS